MIDEIGQQSKWALWCKLTCWGGSEKGECPCKNPKECQLQNHPAFPDKRKDAMARMWRHFANQTEELGGLHPRIREVVLERIKELEKK